MDMTLPALNLAGAAPQWIVAGAGLLIMLVESVFRPSRGGWAAWFALVGLAGSGAWLAVFPAGIVPVFGGALAADGLGVAFSAVTLMASALAVLLGTGFLRREGLDRPEYYVLVLFATAGALIMAAASDLVAVFIGLEVLSISLYVLSAFAKADAASREAGIKYLLLGAFASGFLLYGIAMVYGATGTTQLVEIGLLLRLAQTIANPLLWVGAGLLLVGLGFKLALVPFHSWAPDVYQGAPIPVTAFMSVVSKAAAFAALLRVLLVVLAPIQQGSSLVLAVLAVLTMTVGNLLALVQNEVKRLLAYSSIAQAGYLLVAVVAGQEVGAAAVLFYLLGYVFTNLGAFAVLIGWSRRGEGRVPAADLAGLGFKQPWMAAALTLFLLSLTGIPLTAGFVGKLYVFGAAVREGYVWLVLVAVLNSVLSAFYYLHLVVIMYMREPAGAMEVQDSGWPLRLGLVACTVGVLVLGLVPGPALEWAQQAVALVLR
ncbi:MAG: NADH-quinone oxidoreductase subunit N [Anaerolineae bacterium]